MKKIFTFLLVVCVGTLSFAQTVFQSNLSSWAAGVPTDWMGSKTSISPANVVEQTVGATYGTSMASLINATATHKRFTTQPVTVTPGETYLIEMWVACQTTGQLRTAYYDLSNLAYSTYNSYIDVAAASAGNLVLVSQTVTLPAGCTSVEFILSVVNTDPATAPSPFFIGILVDSVAITVSAPPVSTPATIFQIQNTTTPPYDSPYNTQLVETSGVVTGVQYNGYYLQDGNGPWNGVFVLDYTNIPNRGDVVTITGTVDEYFNYTEIKNVIIYNAVAGGVLPTPSNISTLAANEEQYEGCLVKVLNANCTADTTSNAFREWTITDGSGALVADDKMFIYAPTVSTAYNVTGIMDFAFSVPKLLPRDILDIAVATGIIENENNTVLVYPNPASNVLHFEMDINNATVKIIDVTGKTIKTVTANSNKFSIALTNFANGIYFYSIIDANNNTISTNRFIVAK